MNTVQEFQLIIGANEIIQPHILFSGVKESGKGM